MKLKFLALITISALASIPISAEAAPLLFNFSGPSGTAIFELDSNPKPDFSDTVFPGSDQFGFYNVSGTYGGIAGVASEISFGDGIIASLNIDAPNLGFTQFAGSSLFTGTASDPIFTPGIYTLPNPFFGNGTLTISSVAGVPEPGTWAMVILGLGLTGATMRYRQRMSSATA